MQDSVESGNKFEREQQWLYWKCGMVVVWSGLVEVWLG